MFSKARTAPRRFLCRRQRLYKYGLYINPEAALREPHLIIGEKEKKKMERKRERESTVKSRAKANPARAQNSYPSDFPISPRVSSCLFFAWRRFSVKSRKNEHVAMMGNLGESRWVSRGGLSNQFVSCLLYVTLIRAAEQHRQKRVSLTR